MSALSSALAAMDKATPEEWTATARIDPTTRAEAAVWGSDGDMVCMVYGGYKGSEYVEAIDRAKYIASRPDALAWIKEALPVLMSKAQEVRQDLDPIFGKQYSDSEVRKEDEAYLARLDALLAEAKGDNHAEN